MPSLSYVSVTRLFEIVGTQSNKPVFYCRFLLSAFTVCNNCVYCKKYLSKTLRSLRSLFRRLLCALLTAIRLRSLSRLAEILFFKNRVYKRISSRSDQLRSKGYFASIFLQFFKLQKNLRVTPCFFASDKSHDRFACSFVNALATASALYQLLSVARFARCLIDRVERCRFALYKSETIDPTYKQYAVV